MMHPLALLAVVLAAPAVKAQTISLLVDVNTDPAAVSSVLEPDQRDFSGAPGGDVFFAGYSQATGLELWRSDGTDAGTVPVADLVPGVMGSSPRSFFGYGGRLYFSAYDAVHGFELWTSDGTTAGTSLLADLNPGPAISSPRDYFAWNGWVYFSAYSANKGRELWRTDGTAAGTSLFFDVYPGSNSGFAGGMVPLPSGNGFVFPAFTAEAGLEPWVSDGTVLGTKLLKNIVPIYFSSVESKFMPLGGLVFFIANDPIVGHSLWQTDGTEAGTVLVVDLDPSSKKGIFGVDFAELNGELFFKGSNSIVGSELWKTDGTPGGTGPAADVLPGPDSGNAWGLTTLGGKLYFFANSSVSSRVQLMSIGSTPESLSLVKNLPFASLGPSTPANLQAFGNRLMFTLGDTVNGREWWVSDGTGAGTHLLVNLDGTSGNSAGDHVIPVASGLGLLFSYVPLIGYEVFGTDGTAAGTGLVKDLQPAVATFSSGPRHLTAIGQRLFFQGMKLQAGSEPYCYTLGDAAAVPLGDLYPGAFSSSPELFTAVTVGNEVRVFFTATAPDTGNELYVTDGTPAGTHLVKDINSVPDYLPITEIASVGGYAVFAAYSTDNGRELWKSDGTAAGTQVLADIRPGAGSSTPETFFSFGDRLFFAADDQIAGRELWITDGTQAGTQLFVDLVPGSSGSVPRTMTRVGERFAFFARLANNQTAFYVSDGTAAGTTLVSDLGGNFVNGPAESLPVLDGVVFFVSRTIATGYELWRSDLTAAGTYMVTDLNVGPGDTLFSDFEVAGDALFFVADAASVGVGKELWVSDGTAIGTHLVSDLVPGPDDAQIANLTAVGERVYFSANGGPEVGVELHVSDGLTTTLVSDTTPYSIWSSATLAASSIWGDFVLIGGKLVYSGAIDLVGIELLAIDDPGAHAVDLGLGANGPFLELDAPVIGTSPELRMTGGITTGLNTVLLSSPLGNPLWGSGLMPSNLTWLNPSVLVFLAQTTSADLAFTFAIPANPNLIGQRFNLQAASVDPSTLPGIALGNGVQVVLGL